MQEKSTKSPKFKGQEEYIESPKFKGQEEHIESPKCKGQEEYIESPKCKGHRNCKTRVKRQGYFYMYVKSPGQKIGLRVVKPVV